MKKTQTCRGFDIINFKDSYKVDCTLQKSSTVDSHIWLGPSKNTVQELTGDGWKTNELKKNQQIYPERMHLTRIQVLKLIPHLIKFIILGEI